MITVDHTAIPSVVAYVVGMAGIGIFSLCIRGWLFCLIEWFTIGRRICPDCRHQANYHMRSKKGYIASKLSCRHVEQSTTMNSNGYMIPATITCGCTLDRTLIYFNQHMLAQPELAQHERSILSMSEDELRRSLPGPTVSRKTYR